MNRSKLLYELNVCVGKAIEQSARKFNVSKEHVQTNFFQFSDSEKTFILKTIIKNVFDEFKCFGDESKFLKSQMKCHNLKQADVAKWIEKTPWCSEWLALSKIENFGLIDLKTNKIQGLKNQFLIKNPDKIFANNFTNLLNSELDYFIGYENRISKRPKETFLLKKSRDFDKSWVKAYGYEFRIHCEFDNRANFEIKKIKSSKKHIEFERLLKSFRTLFGRMKCVKRVRSMEYSIMIEFKNDEEIHQSNENVVDINGFGIIHKKIEEMKRVLDHKENALNLSKIHVENLETDIILIKNDLEILSKAADILNNQTINQIALK